MACMDTLAWRGVSPRHRWAWARDAAPFGHCRHHVHCRILADSRARKTLFLSGPVPSSGPVRNIHSSELFSLVHLLGAKPHPRLLPHPAVGWASTSIRSDPIFRLHDVRKRDIVARVSCLVSLHGNIRFSSPV